MLTRKHIPRIISGAHAPDIIFYIFSMLPGDIIYEIPIISIFHIYIITMTQNRNTLRKELILWVKFTYLIPQEPQYSAVKLTEKI